MRQLWIVLRKKAANVYFDNVLFMNELRIWRSIKKTPANPAHTHTHTDTGYACKMVQNTKSQLIFKELEFSAWK